MRGLKPSPIQLSKALVDKRKSRKKQIFASLRMTRLVQEGVWSLFHAVRVLGRMSRGAVDSLRGGWIEKATVEARAKEEADSLRE